MAAAAVRMGWEAGRRVRTGGCGGARLMYGLRGLGHEAVVAVVRAGGSGEGVPVGVWVMGRVRIAWLDHAAAAAAARSGGGLGSGQGCSREATTGRVLDQVVMGGTDGYAACDKAAAPRHIVARNSTEGRERHCNSTSPAQLLPLRPRPRPLPCFPS